jgi:hypothetical protein
MASPSLQRYCIKAFPIPAILFLHHLSASIWFLLAVAIGVLLYLLALPKRHRRWLVRW